MAMLAHRHRDWGSLLVLPPQTLNVAQKWGGDCQAPFTAVLRERERLQVALTQKRLAWKAVAQPHLPMVLLALTHRDCGCLFVLPPKTSNVSHRVPAGLLSQPCSENVNVSRQLLPRRGYLEMLLLSLICPWHCAQRGTETGAACLSSHIKLQTYPRGSLPGSFRSPAPKRHTLQKVRSQKGLEWKAVAQPHLPMALLAQRHRDWGCFLVLPPQTSNVAQGLRVPVGIFQQPSSENANVSR